jgi:Tol biopolymer transport system component
MLVYGGRDLEGDRYRLWFRRWNSLDATPLEGSDGAIFPVFSPDGQEIAFNSPGGVRVVSAHGGEPRTLAQGALAGTAWSEDGVWVYFADAFVGLKRVPADGGPVETVTVVDTAAGETGYFDPEVLPGDKALLFVAGTAEGYVIVVLDMETGEVRHLVSGVSPSFYPTGHLLFLDNEGTLHAAPFDVGQLELTGAAVPVIEGLAMANPPRGWHSISKTGTLVYVAGGVSDNLTPVWVARDGTAVEIDPDWRTTGLVYSVALSPNADRLAISVQASAAIRDLWVKQLYEGPLSRLTFEGSFNGRASWSSDGQSLTFISNRAGQQDLWTKRADGSGSAEILLDREGTVSEAFFSSDGTWLIYREIGINSGISDIFAIQPGLDSVPIPIVVRSGFNAHSPALSPDGRWLVYVSDESGQEEVYVRPFPDADTGQWPVSRSGGTEPVWAHSGRELFYRNGANEIVAVRVVAGSSFAWDRQDVLFSASDYRIGRGHPMFDVSPDDERFVMLRYSDEGPWELILVQNFFEELERLVPN